jgi:hypothetical protein
MGWDPRRFWASTRFLPTFIRDALALNAQRRLSADQFQLRWVPILSDRHMPGGTAKGHYFHQDLWAARRIYAANPKEHIDVGSRIDGFIAHLLTFRSVRVLDVRPLSTKVSGLTFAQANLMNEIPSSLTADSVSCLHALEHFGLGRYGDPLDFDGWRKGLANLARITSRDGGRLYLSIPIGDRQAIEFNAQRIFHPQTIVDAASDYGLELLEFSYVDDAGDLIESIAPGSARCEFGCGCYVFQHVSTATS